MVGARVGGPTEVPPPPPPAFAPLPGTAPLTKRMSSNSLATVPSSSACCSDRGTEPSSRRRRAADDMISLSLSHSHSLKASPPPTPPSLSRGSRRGSLPPYARKRVSVSAPPKVSPGRAFCPLYVRSPDGRGRGRKEGVVGGTRGGGEERGGGGRGAPRLRWSRMIIFENFGHPPFSLLACVQKSNSRGLC